MEKIIKNPSEDHVKPIKKSTKSNNDNKNMIKKEFSIEGLDCANCAAKIEDRLNKVKDVGHANVNFVTKTLTIEINNASSTHNVISEATALIKKIEPDVTISEKTSSKNTKKEFSIEGLDCANCAAKIENKLNETNGISYANVNFVTKILTIEIDKTNNVSALVAKVTDIIKKLEPDVTITEIKEDIHVHNHTHGENTKKEIIRFGIGAAIFALAGLINFSDYIKLALYIISYVIVGYEVVLKSLKNIKRGEVFDENFLMSIATIGAFAIHQYPEAAAVMLFYQVGEILQGIAVNRSRKSITSLMDIRPDFANLKINGELKKVSPEKVSIGDIIVVKPGEKVPLDGKVIEGTSMIDTSALTGEAVPRKIEEGSSILSGVINKNGLLTIEVEKSFGQSTISKILNLVQNAINKKAPTENFITKFAKYYTPVVVFGALALAVIPPLVTGDSFSIWIYRALSFLVVSCPCALVVSIPLGFFGGIGGASKKGILVKGGNYLEALNNVDIVVFDKTGTLTRGVFKVTEIKPENNIKNDELLTYAAFAESYSNHPIATSILNAYGKEVSKNMVSDYEEISGYGIKVSLNGKKVLVGNSKLMTKENVAYNNVDTIGSVVHVAVENEYAGYIVISDKIKEDSKDAIKKLKSLGIKKTVMLTGDNKAVGNKVSQMLDLDEVHAELLPDQKVYEIERLFKEKSKKGKLVFVGDGINDAPVLARADIGIAMGGVGSDAAIEAADVVIMTDEPSKIASAIKIAKRTRSIVMQNIIFALAIKAVLLVLVAIGVGTMWEAVFGDVGVTLIAVLNSMRAMKSE